MANSGTGQYPDPRAYGDNHHLQDSLVQLTDGQLRLESRLAGMAGVGPGWPPAASGRASAIPSKTLMTAALGTSLGPSQAPASSSAAGVPGQITWDTGYVYICIADGAWVRAALSTF